MFRGNISPTSSGPKSKPGKKLAEADGKLSLYWLLVWVALRSWKVRRKIHWLSFLPASVSFLFQLTIRT
jgi:hypothetical protein